jgi:hypothetical protein
MPDIPAEAIEAAAEAINEAHAKRGWNKPQPWWVNEVATAALEAAAPILAETVAQKILEHMESFGPRKPRGPLETSLNGIGGTYRAWRRHFGIAARIAAEAFDTREDQLRKAAEAIARGDYVACNPEVPSE